MKTEEKPKTEKAEKSEEHGGPRVEFTYLKTNEEAKFHAQWKDKLSDIWDTAYTKLEEARDAEDQLQCEDGTSLMPHLSLTLEQLRDQRLCLDRKFQIRGRTGGATWLH